MADARALLRAKRQEARVSHPLASYNAAGQLRCAICGTLVKHASAWEGHLGSKAHRTNVARIKEEERLREEARAQKRGEEEQHLEDDAAEEEMQASSGYKRAADEETAPSLESKKQKLDANNAFPTDFFSDPSRAPVLENDSGDEKEEEPGPQTQQPSAIDLEYQRFQMELLEAPSFKETYERATVVAEPVLALEVPQGPFAAEGSGEPAAEEQPELTEEEKRQQKETEERELIMDRLVEEERAQEEVDMKVQMMKNRVEAFKKRREAARAAKSW